MPRQSILNRFLDKVSPEPMSGCWLWTACAFPKGYGQFRVSGKNVGAHRMSYRLFRGRIGGLHVLHTCDVPACVNPDHLFLGTNGDNMKDAIAKGRIRQDGEHNRRAVLSALDVRVIRRLRGRVTQVRIAEMFGVSSSHVSDIMASKRWPNA